MHPPLFEHGRPLTDADIESYRPDLENLQGNILKSHGRGAAVHLFLTFLPGKRADARRFLHRFGTEITSAQRQLEDARHFRRTQKPEHWFTSLCLSAAGYEYLGFSTEVFSEEFRKGMREAKLDDPPSEKWESKFRRTIHAMIILADDRVEVLTEQLSRRREEIAEFAAIGVEFGLTMRNEAENPIEHFGYADGVSQPLFFESDLKHDPKHWDPRTGPKLVLVRDPHGNSQRACGTYFVFRKLEQNVRDFKATEARLADVLKLAGEDRERAGGMVVGRFEDGTPVVLHDEAESSEEPENDFTYEGDPHGSKCPFSGHIRMMNPRTQHDKPRRIARRGITYGDPTPPAEDDVAEMLPQGGVGLLFQCCQADLASQFEYLQRLANEGSERSGPDPVIGQAGGLKPPDQQEFPKVWNTLERATFHFHGFVTMKGGEYFFAPSLSFFEKL